MRFNFEATGIGSVPFTNPKEACRIVFENFPKIPFWPQLPKRSFLENMYVQYAEGMPGIVVDQARKTIHVDSGRAYSELERTYERYLADDIDFFAITEERAAGLYEFLDIFPSVSVKASFVKGHITGPVSFALSVTDENKRPVIYDKDLFEAITKALVMKAKWQIAKLKKILGNVIIFIDEPYLVSIGSSYVNIDAALASEKIGEAAQAIREAGAFSAIHCCGNTDWSMLLKRDIDIINFDAYNFVKEFVLYADDIRKFAERGGTIAWGIVPSSEAIDRESAASLAARLDSAVEALASRGIGRETIGSLITPSCGLGSLDEIRAKKIMASAAELSGGITKKAD